MRRIVLALLAASSLLSMANAAPRPRYGGTLRVAMRAAPVSLDPVDLGQSGAMGANLSALMFDTLVALDDQGRPQPALATAWQSEPGNQRWQLTIRAGVTFSDGSAVTADAVAASLRAANPGWRVVATGSAVAIQTNAADPQLPAELALARNGIARRAGGRTAGTGAFAVTQWDAGKKLWLAAREDYWAGRPFLNSVEIDLGRNLRDQVLGFDLGKTDVIEIAPEQMHRALAEGRRVESSSLAELVALVFSRDPQTPEEGRLRGALALSIDRGALNSVLLQNGGEPAGGLLPNWLSGYEFLFPAAVDLAKARQIRGEAKQAAAWTLNYDAADPTARLIAERVALNARDAGLTLQPTNGAADVRLVRISLASLDARLALTKLEEGLGTPVAAVAGNSAEELYSAESAAVQSRRTIPLLHVRSAFAVAATVRSWTTGRDGSWRLADVWLETGGAGQ